MRLGLIFLLLFSHLSVAEEIRFGIGLDKPPYVMENASTGMELDIIKAALAHKGHTVVFQQFSQHSLNTILGKRVTAINFCTLKDRSHFAATSHMTYRNAVISKKAADISLNNVQDMTQYRMIAWPGAHQNSGAEFAKFFHHSAKDHTQLNYQELASQEKQSLLFWMGRTDLVLMDLNIFHWYRKQLANLVNTEVDVQIHSDLIPAKHPVSACFESETIRDDFNAGLRHLINSGEYERILDRYLSQ